MIKINKDATFIRIVSSNGASYALPIEIVRGIKSGELDTSRYDWAYDFIKSEDPTSDITFKDVQELFEANV